MAYSMDLRKRVLTVLQQGQIPSSVARRFSVCVQTVFNWQQRAAQGRLEPAKPGPTQPRKITPADDRVLREQVAAQPGIIAKELLRMISAKVVESTVDRRLIALGLRRKKRRYTRPRKRARTSSSAAGIFRAPAALPIRGSSFSSMKQGQEPT